MGAIKEYLDVEQPLYQGLNKVSVHNHLRGPQPFNKITRLCRTCRTHLGPEHYSMHRYVAAGSEDMLCNTCRTNSSANHSFLRDEVPAPNWSEANCIGQSETESHNQFFGEDKDLGRKLCADCPISALCLSYGQATRSTGVWGGEDLQEGALPDIPQSGMCRNGHEWTQDTVRFDSRGLRVCLQCRTAAYERKASAEKARRAAVRAAKPFTGDLVHCKRGHLREGAAVASDGRCRECHKITSAKYRAKMKAS